MIGIYAITNTTTNKKYVGSSIDINRRKSEHFSLLKYNKHPNIKLQTDYNKYGIDSFVFEVLTECEEKELLNLEEEAIEIFDSYNSGYNNCPYTGGSVMSTLAVRQKHWGPLHGGSKYTVEEITNVFNLLAETDLTHAQIAEKCNVNVSTVSYIATGGHEWLHLNNIEKANKIANRTSAKQTISIYSEEQILEVMKLLLDNPKLSFADISDITKVEKSTVSAISSGRQHASIIYKSTIADKAKEYHKLGKINYAKKYCSQYTTDELIKILDVIEKITSTGKWHGRDLIEKLGLSPALARKLSEFDHKLLVELLSSGIPKAKDLVANFVHLRKYGKGARNISEQLENVINDIMSKIDKPNE